MPKTALLSRDEPRSHTSLRRPGPGVRGAGEAQLTDWGGEEAGDREVREQMAFELGKFSDHSPEVLLLESMERDLIQHPLTLVENLKVQMKIKHELSDKSP